MFEFIATDDGSPTVRIHGPEAKCENVTGRPAGSSESMHSLRGAFSETVYIYGDAIEHCLNSNYTPRVLSIGLGLGYVEILAAALAIKHQKNSVFSGESFEVLSELSAWFCGWLKNDSEVPKLFTENYDLILARTAEFSGVAGATIRGFIIEMFESRRWKIRGALDASTLFTERFGCICFDAFSSKSTPDLWQEDFLKNFLNQACAQDAVLSTYACTGQLKRALLASGFELQIRAGFASKRDSTFAVRQKNPAIRPETLK